MPSIHSCIQGSRSYFVDRAMADNFHSKRCQLDLPGFKNLEGLSIALRVHSDERGWMALWERAAPANIWAAIVPLQRLRLMSVA